MIYTAVTLDGREHAGLAQGTLKQWYFARRLKLDSLILCPETGEWKLLKNLFDAGQWEAEERKTRGLGPNESVFKESASPQQLLRPSETMAQTPYHYNRDNERGLRAAGTLLCINAAMTVVSLVLIAWSQPNSPELSSVWGFNILLDIVIGLKLLKSDNAIRWQKIALVRVGLGVLLAVLIMLIGPNQLIRLLGMLQLVFASSFLLLLLGEASRARVVVGVLAFVLSTCGAIGLLTLMSSGAVARYQILEHALPTRSFTDLPSGSNVQLPNGWVMLPTNNPIVPHPDAKMIAVHPDTDSYVTLDIVKNESGPSLDSVLSAVVAEKRNHYPTLVEVERVDSTMFRRLDGRKAVLTWEHKGRQIKGAVSVARNSPYYIFLNEWCAAETYATSGPQFRAFEASASAGEPQPDPFSDSSWKDKLNSPQVYQPPVYAPQE